MESQADLTLGEQTAYRPLSPKLGLPRPKQLHPSLCALSEMAVTPSFHLHTLPFLCMLRKQLQLTIFSLLQWKVQFSSVISETWDHLLNPSLRALVVSLQLLPLPTRHPVLGSLTPCGPTRSAGSFPLSGSGPIAVQSERFSPWAVRVTSDTFFDHLVQK